MSFTTVDDVALYIDMPLATLSQTNLAQMNKMILYVDGLINNYCGWPLLATDYVNKRFNGTGTRELDLRAYPINTLSAVQLRAPDGSTTDITSDVEVIDDGVIGLKPNAVKATVFTLGSRNVVISFNAGFTTVPHDLVYAATHLVGLNYKRVAEETFDMQQEGFDQKTSVYTTIEIPDLLRRTLDRYRLVSIF